MIYGAIVSMGGRSPRSDARCSICGKPIDLYAGICPDTYESYHDQPVSKPKIKTIKAKKAKA